MAVIILHPTEELKLINFQKELISELFIEGRILVAASPLWIRLESSEQIKAVNLGGLEVTGKSIYIPVTIKTAEAELHSKLTLVNIHGKSNFSPADLNLIAEKKQPVSQLKVFRLGDEKNLSPVAKCISKSVWCKLCKLR